MYPSWHLSLVELGTVFSNHFSTKQKACLTSLRIQCQVCGSSRRGRGTTTCRKKKDEENIPHIWRVGKERK